MVKRNIKTKPKGRKPKGLILKLMCTGYSNDQIVEYLVQEYKYTKHYAECLVSDCKLLVDKKIDELAEEVALNNLNRLEAIITDNLENGNDKTALQAIDLENKLTKVYETKVQLKTDPNEPFVIKLQQ